MDSVQLIGRPTDDATATATTASGTPTSLGLTIDRPGRNGTDYFTIRTCQRIAEIAAQHLSRGRRVAIVGRLEHLEWTVPDGARHSHVQDVANQLVGLAVNSVPSIGLQTTDVPVVDIAGGAPLNGIQLGSAEDRERP